MSVHHYFPLKVLEGIRAIEHRKISSIMPQFMATIFLSFPLSNFHLLPSISSHASSLLWSYDSFRFCSFLILSRAEGDHFIFNKAPLKYREVVFYCSIGSISQLCAAYSITKTSYIATTHKTYPVPLRSSSQGRKWRGRKTDTTREGRTELDGLLWHGTPVNRRHCSLSGCLLALSRWTEELIYR